MQAQIKEREVAVRRRRIQSEIVIIGRRRRVRPHHHAQTVFSDFWLAISRKFEQVQISRRTKADRKKGGVPAPRVKQRVKIKDVALSVPYPHKMQAGRNGNQQSEDREVVVCCLFERCRNACLSRDAFTHQYDLKEIQNNARSQIKRQREKKGKSKRRPCMPGIRCNAEAMLQKGNLVMVNIGYHRRIA
jgi:hypothetical protein